MTWQAVARKDFRDSIRSYWLIGLTAIFTLLVSLAAAGVSLLGPVSSSAVLGLLDGLLIATTVPLLALVVSYAGIAGERDSGSMKLLLSLPHAREDVVFGKFLGRATAMSVAVFVGFLLPGVVLALLVPFEAVKYLGYVVFVASLSTVFVAIGIGMSALASTQRRALAAALAFYFLFAIVLVLFNTLGLFTRPLLMQAWPEPAGITFDQFFLGFRVVNPVGAFKILAGSFLADQLFAPAVENGFDRTTQVSALLMQLFWIAGSLAVGLWRFQDADL
jgi:ABC-2 type transport system permease protein